jgi:hypothetical protein
MGAAAASGCAYSLSLMGLPLHSMRHFSIIVFLLSRDRRCQKRRSRKRRPCRKFLRRLRRRSRRRQVRKPRRQPGPCQRRRRPLQLIFALPPDRFVKHMRADRDALLRDCGVDQDFFLVATGAETWGFYLGRFLVPTLLGKYYWRDFVGDVSGARAGGGGEGSVRSREGRCPINECESQSAHLYCT